jgi:dihydroorotate dehydrogenase electron transfer subunit
MAKTVQDFHVVDNKKIKKDFFILTLATANQLPLILPGQFVQVRIDDSPQTFLRRPFSVHDVDYANNTVKLLVQIAGKGTESLASKGKGDSINLVCPLGNSFTMPGKEDKILLVGGGCGIAPLYFLAKYLRSNSYEFDILMGFRNRDRILEYEEYTKLARVFITTEDGSEGEKGFVTQHSQLTKEKYTRIYCCGPDAMMKSIGKYALKHNIHCEVSLENLMGCGFGVCLCCIVDTVEGNVCSCTEGPVFNINKLKW